MHYFEKFYLKKEKKMSEYLAKNVNDILTECKRAFVEFYYNQTSIELSNAERVSNATASIFKLGLSNMRIETATAPKGYFEAASNAPVLVIELSRPGILIGKKGTVISALESHLKTKCPDIKNVKIVEVNSFADELITLLEAEFDEEFISESYPYDYDPS